MICLEHKVSLQIIQLDALMVTRKQVVIWLFHAEKKIWYFNHRLLSSSVWDNNLWDTKYLSPPLTTLLQPLVRSSTPIKSHFYENTKHVVIELISAALMRNNFHLRYTLNTSWWPRGIGTHDWFFSLQLFLTIAVNLGLSQEHKMHFERPLFYLFWNSITLLVFKNFLVSIKINWHSVGKHCLVKE